MTVTPPPGQLSISPTDSLDSSGTSGGPFSPANVTYTLSNPGGLPITWTAAKTQSWVSLSKTGGTLAAGASDTVTVSIGAGADSLAINTYSDTVTFTNVTNGSGNSTRAVSLAVIPTQGQFSVSPASGLNSVALLVVHLTRPALPTRFRTPGVRVLTGLLPRSSPG